jgi:serine-type D-Ala-D-Ala carboxypeptidase (penicillin-binding protein 5/6)
MTRLGVLEEGMMGRGSRRRRGRPPRRWRATGFVLLVVAVALAALLVFMASRTSGPPLPSTSRATGKAHHHHTPSSGGYGATLAAVHVRPRFKQPVQSGLLFDVHSGKVLWLRNASKRVPIASLTKMMTALVVAAHSRPSERVLIRRAAIDYSGSGVGLLPLHKQVRLETLLYGLMLPSGNDAAIALAQHVAGTQTHFIGMMNAEARDLGLRCTHFTTVSGIVDLGNYSCATDLAVMAHAVLTNHRLGHIVATSSIVLPFPIKGGKLYLYNNNPLLRTHYRGADGVKTGYTLAAGRCLVAAARRGHKWLGVVLLHSEDPPDQATQLLDKGFATRGA